MEVEIKVPEVGEAVGEALLAQWYKREGDLVRRDEILFLIETDKVTLEIAAKEDGYLKIRVPEGQTVKVGSVVGILDTEAVPAEAKVTEEEREEKPTPEVATRPVERPPSEREVPERIALSPSVRRLMDEKGLDASEITGSGPGGRITKGDVLLHLEEKEAPKKARRVEKKPVEPKERPEPEAAERHVEFEAAAPPEYIAQPPPEAEPKVGPSFEEQTTRKPMSRIRQRIAERLLQAKQNTAMLTTFNEIDMSRLQAIRSRFKDAFREKHGVSLGIMSFFIKAVVVGLKEFPELNSFIDGKDIIYHHYYHIGVAVGAERGLVVPVIRHADRLSFSELEQSIVDYVGKIKENSLEIADLEGGTFTISNGGIYGSLLSTPILNPPQSGILGMHKIEDRPVVVEGEIAIRPMMYVALSYDHRIVDGREAVTFLKRIKECIENPERIMMEI